MKPATRLLAALVWVSLSPVLMPAMNPAPSQPTELPAFRPHLKGATLRSRLPCPPGTQPYTHGSSLYCAFPDAGFGKGRTGPWLHFHPNGRLATQGQYLNSVPVGAWWFFDEQGMVERYEAYDDQGRSHGLQARNFPNGSRQFEKQFVHGNLEGEARMWAESGQLWSVTVYKDGREVSSRVFDVDLKAATREELDAQWARVRALEAEQKKLLRQQAPVPK